MFQEMDMLWMKLKGKCAKGFRNFAQEEKGASDIVAIMVVIVILLAVAAIFRTQLIELVENVFGKAIDWVDAN